MEGQTTRPFNRFFLRNNLGARARNPIGGWTNALNQKKKSISEKAVDVARGWVDRQYGMAKSDLVGYALFKGLSMLPIPMIDDAAMVGIVQAVHNEKFSIPNPEAHRLMKLLAVRGVPQPVRNASKTFLAKSFFNNAVRKMSGDEVSKLRGSVYKMSEGGHISQQHANTLISHINVALNSQRQMNHALDRFRRAPPRFARA